MTKYAYLHLEIPKMPIAILAMDTIGRLLVTSKGHHYALTAICLHMSFAFAVPLKEEINPTHNTCIPHRHTS